jgi:hypothetical protein
MSSQSTFCVNCDGHVVWGSTQKRVHEQELISMSKELKHEFGRLAANVLQAPIGPEKIYGPW